GSGLSAQNLITPSATVRLLDHARGQPWGAVYRAAQAEPGVEGTTLENRLPGFEGRLFAKTGTIANVNALSGYVTTRTGRELIFSILTNGSGRPAPLVRQAIDRVVLAIDGVRE
ncbi:MAG TPA: D-alanyl-D-alanine carboxypeptidase, partial [Gemmatimonadales bacterium]|nr:D-alanyl-D-alanine carboxypeptidase [Gemmatimonadales bacterium]